jgi:hypothetical protein
MTSRGELKIDKDTQRVVLDTQNLLDEQNIPKGSRWIRIGNTFYRLEIDPDLKLTAIPDLF